ncbi:MAG: aminoacyl-tRNA hydrolase [Verrucomicrobia bacterium]|nr:aminoacyl-tRNA hydrolase [Verrucomicrobiota bacterium]
MEQWRLIVGLGNPGRRYARTRHNAGFMALETWGRRGPFEWVFEKRFGAQMAWANVGGCRVALCRPETFMNASGKAVGAVACFYRFPPERLLVVVDDADLPLGEVRMRTQGSSGGHHGLESIERELGTRRFARLRIGIGRSGPGRREITDHVLARFRPEETGLLARVLERAADQMDCWVRHGAARAMNQFNGVIGTPIESKATE